MGCCATNVTNGIMQAVKAFQNLHMIPWQSTRCWHGSAHHDIKGPAAMTQISSLQSKIESLSTKVEDNVKVSQAALVAKVEQLTTSMKNPMKLVRQSLKEQEQSVDIQT